MSSSNKWTWTQSWWTSASVSASLPSPRTCCFPACHKRDSLPPHPPLPASLLPLSHWHIAQGLHLHFIQSELSRQVGINRRMKTNGEMKESVWRREQRDQRRTHPVREAGVRSVYYILSKWTSSSEESHVQDFFMITSSWVLFFHKITSYFTCQLKKESYSWLHAAQ